MAAANGTMVLVGTSGKSYSVDFYSPDAAATQLTFAPTGAAAATSSTTYRAPEDMIITDISMATGTANAGVVLSSNGNAIAGGVIRWANFLNTLNNRPRLAIPIRRGDFLGGVTV